MSNTHKTLDYSGRQCVACGSTTTYLQTKRNNNPNWYVNWESNGESNGYLCNVCYNRKRRDGGLEPLKYPHKRVCITCGTTETRKKKDGYPIWSFYKDGRICYTCKLAQMREQSITSNKEGACNSETCVNARKANRHNGFDYVNHNRCIACITNYPKGIKHCPCCGAIMRSRPRKGRNKDAQRLKHGLKPPVYY